MSRESGPEFLQESWSQRIMARCDHLAYIHFIEKETKPWEVQWPAQDHDQLVTKSQVEFRESGPFCVICPFPFAMSNPVLQGLVKGSKPEGWEQEGLSSCSELLGELWVGQCYSHLYEPLLLPSLGRGRSAGAPGKGSSNAIIITATYWMLPPR